MSRRDAAQVLGMVAWVRQRLTAIQKSANAAVDLMHPEEALHAHVEIDGQPKVVSKTIRVQPSPELECDDPVKFALWVQERWPTEIVPAVSEAFLEQLKDRMKAHPEGVLEDDAGEVCQWVEMKPRTAYTRTSLTKDADALEPLLSHLLLADLPDYIEGADK